MSLTPVEFGRFANLEKSEVEMLLDRGALNVIRKKIGNVERKIIPLEAIQDFYKSNRDLFQTNPAGAEEKLGDLGRRGDRWKSPSSKIQMFYNVKGGTGKSTISAQFAMRAAMSGFKVLAVDLDGQGHLSLNLDVLDSHERPTVYDILINDLPVEDAIFNVAPYLDLIPANLGLCNIEIPLNQKPRREYRLSEALFKIAGNYDLIVADTNPAASILNCSMLVASDLVNVVCATNPLSFHGLSLVMSTIEEMEREFRKQVKVRIIPNMYDNREVISQEVLGELKSQFPDRCTQVVINRSADMNEATKRRTSVWDVNTRGTAASDINALSSELIFC